MMISTPSISLVIPTYNNAAYVSEAIESVLAQRYAPLQIIVVDDGSTDDTMNIVSSYRQVLYIKQMNCGIAAARNAGIPFAQGEFLAFLDADDLFCEDKLAKQVECFKNNPELDMVFGYIDEFLTPEAPIQLRAPLRLNAEGYVAGSMLIRTKSFAKVGNFSTKLRTGEFIDWLLRAKDGGLKSGIIDRVVLRRRLHANNTSRTTASDRNDYVKLLKASLDRRRSKPVAN